MDIKRLMAQMQNAQKTLEKVVVKSNAGGENGVDIELDGKFKIKNLKINFMPSSKEDLEIMEDLIKKAFEEAFKLVEAEIKKHTGGMF